MPTATGERLISTAAYAAAALLSLAIAAGGLRLWNADLCVPLAYDGDALMAQMWVKGICDHGWYLENPSLGMPFDSQMYDFPMADNCHFLLLKLCASLTPNFAAATNVFYLLHFPLSAWSAMFVLRSWGVSRPNAVAGGVLFSVLPYHFLRGEHHPCLAAYFIVPLLTMVAVDVLLGKATLGERFTFLPLFPRRPETIESPRLRGKPALHMAICLLASGCGVYYAFFGCFLLLAGGWTAMVSTRSARPLAAAALYTGVVLTAIAANLAPHLYYFSTHGRNTQVAARHPFEADLYSLRISELLLPIRGHRAEPLAEIKAQHLKRPPQLRAGGDFMTLGLAGSVGFVLLMAQLLFFRARTAETSVLQALVPLNGAAVLLGATGGFGSLFALLVTPQIRCYDRISIYIGFFSLAALMLLLDPWCRRLSRLGPPRAIGLILAALLLAVATWDQVPRGLNPPYAEVRAEFESDRTFVAGIESSQPSSAMIFQLPYLPYPESAPLHAMAAYDPVRPYLHSKSLRWSCGATRGRRSDLWQAAVSQLPPDELLTALRLAGFTGLTVDRNGYEDRGVSLERALLQILRCPAIESPNRRMLYFDLRAHRSAKTDTAGATQRR